MSESLMLSFEGTKVSFVPEGDSFLVRAVLVEKLLGYSNPAQAIRKNVESKHISHRDILVTTRNAYGEYTKKIRVIFLLEPGLYALILSSEKPQAKRFKAWVTEEVLPAIRKTGRYMMPGTEQKPSTAWRKFFPCLSCQWIRAQRTPCIGPLERLGHGLVEIVNKGYEPLPELVNGGETGSFEQPPHQETKPDFHLIQPGRMHWGIDKSDAMRWIL